MGDCAGDRWPQSRQCVSAILITSTGDCSILHLAAILHAMARRMCRRLLTRDVWLAALAVLLGLMLLVVLALCGFGAYLFA
jgi:hypothetical protein